LKRYSPTVGNWERRLHFIELVGLFAFITIVGRTWYWQIVQHAFLSARAESRYSLIREVPANRGNIYAKDGSVIATNITTYDISVVADDVADKRGFSAKLSPYIAVPPEDILSKLEKTRGSTILRYKLDKEEYETLKAQDFKELIYTERASRFYPERSLFAQALGFVNLEGKGQYSLEEFFNDILSGEGGMEKFEVDVTRKKSIPLGDRERQEAVEGAEVYTTFDVVLQNRLTKLLEKKVEEFKAERGLILVMETKTGAIPALVQYPSYDPNDYAAFFQEKGNDIFLNAALTNYEPGSVFKVITMAAGLDSGTVTPHTTIYDVGKKTIGKDTIYNWDKKEYGYSDMTNVLMRSSNIGAAFVAEKMGKEVFHKYIQLFGFGKTTGVEMMGESNGTVHPIDRWAEIDLNSIGFGQGIGVTPIQLISAVNVVANKGALLKPRIIDKIIYKGEENVQLPRLLREHVIGLKASQDLTDMLVQVVHAGGAEQAIVPGYTIAGKTGTAQVAKKEGKGYEEQKVIASFVGFGPAPDPQYTILVLFSLNENVGDAYRWGSQTAAPTFAEATKLIFEYYGVQRL